MSDTLYHLTGACGEHWHPNLVNMTALALVAVLILRQHAKVSK